jgi:hypothetical protein
MVGIDVTFDRSNTKRLIQITRTESVGAEPSQPSPASRDATTSNQHTDLRGDANSDAKQAGDANRDAGDESLFPGARLLHRNNPHRSKDLSVSGDASDANDGLNHALSNGSLGEREVFEI